MTPARSNKPTDGALRAAKQIEHNPSFLQSTAELIDRETGVRELTDILENIITEAGDLIESRSPAPASVITSKPAIRYHFKTGQRTSLRTLRCCTVPVVIPARVFSMGGDPAGAAGGSRKGDFSGAL